MRRIKPHHHHCQHPRILHITDLEINSSFFETNHSLLLGKNYERICNLTLHPVESQLCGHLYKSVWIPGATRDYLQLPVQRSLALSSFDVETVHGKVEELVDSVKKARGIKTKERNKDKLSDEERDARKDRKLGRKRDRTEESNSSEHKRRREAQNGEDEQLREREQRHREKSPRERSHEKFDRERGAGGGSSSSRGGGEDRQYNISKSTRSRVNY